MNTETVMNVTEKVLKVIQQNRFDGFTMDGVSPSSIMYTYGATDEFRNIISELEEAFGIEIESDEIGEMTVRTFIDTVINLVGMKKVEKDTNM